MAKSGEKFCQVSQVLQRPKPILQIISILHKQFETEKKILSNNSKDHQKEILPITCFKIQCN